jgi:hypothetical protein
MLLLEQEYIVSGVNKKGVENLKNGTCGAGRFDRV